MTKVEVMPKRFVFLFLTFLFFLIPGLVFSQGSQVKGNAQAFVTFKYADPMTGLEAFRLLIPKGWQVQGGITWSSNMALPAQASFRFYNPGGEEEMTFFPTQAFFWTNNPLFLKTNPPGSLRFGTPVLRPVDWQTAIQKGVISRLRPRAMDLRIVQQKEVPELAQLARGVPMNGVNSSAVAGKVKLQYLEGQRFMEEELFAALSQFVINLPGPGGSPGYFINYWYIDYVFSFRAAKDRLVSLNKTFQTMIYSTKVNPQWFAKVANVKEMLAQQASRNIKAIGKIGEMAARAGSEMRADQMRAWEQRQQVQDKIARNFSDYIRGVDRYNDPLSGKQVELPSGYGRAFANNLGEYIVTESPSYNPNVGSNQNWVELVPVK
jgi:hypothetical protein